MVYSTWVIYNFVLTVTLFNKEFWSPLICLRIIYSIIADFVGCFFFILGLKFKLDSWIMNFWLTKYILDICLLIDLVSNYTREAGVRELERKFGALCRAVAVRVAEKEKGSNGTESSTVSIPFLNNRFLRERGMASTLQMEYQVFLCIFQKNSAMSTLG